MRKPLLAALALSLTLPVHGEGQDGLSLRQAIARARTHNPQVLAVAAAEEATDAQVAQARSAFLPRVDYTESATRSNNPVFVFGSLLNQGRFSEQNFDIDRLNNPDPINNFQSRFDLQQVIFDGRTFVAHSDAKLGRDVAAETRRRTEMAIIFETVRTYFGVLARAKSLEVIRDAISSAEADLARTEALRDAGMATEADVLSLRVHRAGLESEEIRASNQLRILEADLNRIMGVPLEADHELTTPLEPTADAKPRELESLETLEQQALSSRPEIRQSQLQLELARNARKRARSRFYPSLALQAGWQSDRRNFTSGGGNSWVLGGALSLNLFNGLGDRAGLAAAAADERRNQAEKAGAEDAVLLDVRSAYFDLEAAVERVDVATEAVAQARESHRITESRYEAGLTNVTELLRSQNAVLDAEARHLGALYEQRVAATRLELAAGTLNSDSEALEP